MSQISNQIIAMSDFGETLMILGLAVREIFLNNSMWLMKLVTFSLEIFFLSDCKYGIPVILR